MMLLEFARGPALWLSLLVLAGGSVWRVAAILRLGKRVDLSTPRSARPFDGALRNIARRMWPHPQFRLGSDLGALNGYLYHLGLAAIVFGYLPHVRFIERLTGIGWTPLPEALVYVVSALTIIVLLMVLHQRRSDPVKRLLSDFDDYFSWFVVFLPLLTGMAVVGDWAPHPHPGSGQFFPVPIAVHLLSVELLFIWLPFGKLAHAFLVFLSRGVTGAAAARKGATL
jgi:nitrate reductase gamma subunit